MPLITRLDPPFRSVIWGGGPAGPVRPMGSVPPLFPNVHLRPAAKGWRNKAGGRPPKTRVQNTASAGRHPLWVGGCRGGESHLLPTAPSLADSGKPTHFLKDIETKVAERPGGSAAA